MALRVAVRERARGRRRGRRSSRPTTCCWFIPAMALQFGLVGMGAALRGTGNFKPGMIVQTATVILNIVLAPVLIFGWGTGRPLGVAGAAIASLVAIVVGTVWLVVLLRRHERVPAVRARGLEAAIPRCGGRCSTIGLPAGAEFALMAVYLVHRLRDQPAVRRGGAGRVRHRHAHHPGGVHAGRRAGLRGRPGRRTELRRAACRSACATPSGPPR